MKQNIKALEETMAKIRRCEQEVFTTMYSFIFKEAVRRGHLGVYALDSGLRGLVTKCVVFSGKTLDLHSLSPPPWVPGYSQGISTKCWGNPVIRGGGGRGDGVTCDGLVSHGG